MSEKEKSLWGHITDWFKALKPFGNIGLLIALGWILVLVEALTHIDDASIPFCVVVAIGAIMIVLGVYIRILEIKTNFEAQE